MKKRKIAIVVVSLVALILVATLPLMLRAWHQKRQAEKAFDSFASALEHHDYKSAYSNCSVEFVEKVSYDEFVKQQEALQSKFGALTKIRREPASVEGTGSPMNWIGLLRAEHVFANGKLTLLYELHLNNGRWQVFGYRNL